MQRAVLDFYDGHARALPWRASNDPYRVWVAEMMLQQTRVETVIPYYERWLARFPDLATLAAADPDDVLHAWAGLGYYSRARNLHRAARVVREQHAGALPRTARALRTLPGIGCYTAGAVASIAFGEPAAAVDGNVQRVLARLFDADFPPAAARRTAQALVPERRAGDFNQGLMELGATVCLPRAPRCARCPLREACRARAAGTQALRPRPKVRRALPEHHLLTLVLRGPRGVLLARSAAGLLAGMWRFPSIPLEGDVQAAARRAIRRLTGRRTRRVQPLGIVSHAFSHRREHYHAVAAQLGGAVPAPGPPEPHALCAGPDELRWVAATRFPELAVPAAQRRIARLAGLP